MKTKKYKFITIKQDVGLLTPVKKYDILYQVYNNKNNNSLGVISYYPLWRQYIFQPFGDTAFNNTCLRDIIDFMENEINKEE